LQRDTTSFSSSLYCPEGNQMLVHLQNLQVLHALLQAGYHFTKVHLLYRSNLCSECISNNRQHTLSDVPWHIQTRGRLMGAGRYRLHLFWTHVLSMFNHVQTLPNYFLKTHFNIILPPTSKYPKWVSTLQNGVTFCMRLISCYTCYMSYQSHLHCFVHPGNICCNSSSYTKP
jgi:hypothetical protein